MYIPYFGFFFLIDTLRPRRKVPYLNLLSYLLLLNTFIFCTIAHWLLHVSHYELWVKTLPQIIHIHRDTLQLIQIRRGNSLGDHHVRLPLVRLLRFEWSNSLPNSELLVGRLFQIDCVFQKIFPIHVPLSPVEVGFVELLSLPYDPLLLMDEVVFLVSVVIFDNSWSFDFQRGRHIPAVDWWGVRPHFLSVSNHIFEVYPRPPQPPTLLVKDRG